MRWVHKYAPEINKRIRPYLKNANDSLKVDATYIKVRGKWKYLYRSIDSEGNTIDFMFSARRNKKAAIRFFNKVLSCCHLRTARVVSVDKHPAYPGALKVIQQDAKTFNKIKLRKSVISTIGLKQTIDLLNARYDINNGFNLSTQLIEQLKVTKR